MLFEKVEDVPRLFTIWILICIIVISPMRYMFLQFIVATVYPYQSISAFLSLFYLMIIIPIVFSVLYAIGFGLPLLGTLFVATGFKDNPSKSRLFFGSLAAPFIFFLGGFLFFSILQYAAYSTHMLKAKDLIRATNGPAEYFYKYVVDFGTPLSYPQLAYDIGLQNLTYKEKLRLHVASVYLGDSENYYYVTSEFPKYVETRNAYEKLKEGKWPEMTTEESVELAAIRGKILKEPLDDEDLERVIQINRSYEKRVGRSITEDEAIFLTQIIEIMMRYKNEFGNSLLKSLDTKKPFISDKLKKMGAEMRHLGLDSKSGIDADFLSIT